MLDWLRDRPALKRALQVALALAVAGGLLAPRVSEARQALDEVVDVQPRLLVLAVALQLFSIVAEAMVTRHPVPAPDRPSRLDMVRIELATTAATHSIPGGTAAGTVLGYRLLHRSGVSKADAAFAVGVRGVGAAVVLNLILGVALAVSIPLRGFDPVYTAAAGAGMLLLAALGSGLLLLLRWGTGTRDALAATAARLPFLSEETVASGIDRLRDQVRTLLSHPRVLTATAAWAAVYWLVQATSLWVFLAGFGHRMDIDGLLVAFGVSNLLAFIPITPRGLGFVEASLIPMLAGFGAGDVAALGALTWRLAAFWLPIPLGWLSYLTLRIRPPQGGHAS